MWFVLIEPRACIRASFLAEHGGYNAESFGDISRLVSWAYSLYSQAAASIEVTRFDDVIASN
jgi:hypothetical protein